MFDAIPNRLKFYKDFGDIAHIFSDFTTVNIPNPEEPLSPIYLRPYSKGRWSA